MDEDTLFARICRLAGYSSFVESVQAADANRYCKTFTTEMLFKVLLAAQLQGAASMRDIVQMFEENVALQQSTGIQGVARSTLSDALARVDSDLFMGLFQRVSDSFSGRIRKKLRGDFKDVLRLLDSTTVTVPISEYPWAHYQRRQGGFKAHVAFESADGIGYPVQIVLTHGKVSDITAAKSYIQPKPDSIIVADRGYEDKHFFRQYAWCNQLFLIRAKRKTHYFPIAETPTELRTGAIKDEIVVTRLGDCHNLFAKRFRRIVLPPFEGHKEPIILITNIFDRTAAEIGQMYRKRWEIETFFRFIKSQLNITKIYGTTENAVRIQLIVAAIVAIVVAYLKFLNKAAHDGHLPPSQEDPIWYLRKLRYRLCQHYDIIEALFLRDKHKKPRLPPPPLACPVQSELPLFDT